MTDDVVSNDDVMNLGCSMDKFAKVSSPSSISRKSLGVWFFDPYEYVVVSHTNMISSWMAGGKFGILVAGHLDPGGGLRGLLCSTEAARSHEAWWAAFILCKSHLRTGGVQTVYTQTPTDKTKNKQRRYTRQSKKKKERRKTEEERRSR